MKNLKQFLVTALMLIAGLAQAITVTNKDAKKYTIQILSAKGEPYQQKRFDLKAPGASASAPHPKISITVPKGFTRIYAMEAAQNPIAIGKTTKFETEGFQLKRVN